MIQDNRGSAKVAVIVIMVIIGIALFTVVLKYNSLVNGEEQIDAGWAQIENQLQRRFDLIPNLVETVKGYAAHEEAIFTQIAEARTNYGTASTTEEAAAANDELTTALEKLMVIVEAYPDLKANTQFTRLMDELAGTENRLAVARKDYNETVQDFNSHVRTFPGNMIAGMFGFEKKAYFEVNEGVTETPTIDFGGENE
ncbi:LemA family protein [Lysinibacillus sp. KU-BSD001]|uniref:LemA family protein n=1 Tax=Lysinibacillus sp. KU-BSD001 TaxID=3141328 RepID=UPI0036F14B2E